MSCGPPSGPATWSPIWAATFVVLMPGPTGARAACERAEQLRGTVRHGRYTVEGIEVAVDAAVGVTVVPEDGAGVAVLLQRAEVAMYQARHLGRGVQARGAGWPRRATDLLGPRCGGPAGRPVAECPACPGRSW